MACGHPDNTRSRGVVRATTMGKPDVVMLGEEN
jgi:hypothetical protein